MSENHVYNMWEHTSWGNKIRFWDWEDRRITGHYKTLTDKLQVGDELRCKLESGKVGRFEITEIEYQRDPRDMFFGYVKDIGYLEENNE